MNKDTCIFDDVLIKADTAKALLCIIAEDELWVPKSQILADSEVQHRGDRGCLMVTRWWARKAELVENDDENDREHAYSATVIELTQATRAYRQLALEHHPHRVGGDGVVMKALNVLWGAVKADVERAVLTRGDS